ncbi:FeoA family protein [Microseira wollei]|uniref:FeoA family protein n=1 Tax=Microseira wollei NIES-4236 TaxID=2530354 RepID=A0AAV3X5R1_9CYAN|nr:FeoA family protein [Microseira wollei]GET37459.1 FeoA family protein [Microseira wollei NIES-4236]
MLRIHLASLQPGQIGTIAALQAEESLQQRLQALGFRAGRQVEMIRRAWFGGPLHVRVGTTEVMLRRSEAKEIHVTHLSEGE